MTILLEIPKVMNQKIRKAFDLIKAHFDNYPQLNENHKIDPSLIDVDSSNRFVTDAEKEAWNTPSGGGSSYPISELGEIEYYQPLWVEKQTNDVNWSYLNNNTPSGSVTVLSSGAVKLESGTSLFIRFPLTLAGTNGVGFVKPFGSSGNANAEFGAILMYSGIPYTLTVENVTTTSLTTAATTDVSLFSGVGNIFSVSNTLASYGGSGLFIKRNVNVNSGKYTYGKVVNGSITELNSNVSFIGEQITKTKFVYNKQTEIATFYINDVEIGTLSSVNLPDTTQFLPEIGIANNSSSNIFFPWVSRYVKLKKNA